MSTTKAAKKKQGFASMDPERQRAVAAMGGRESHRLGKAYRWTPAEAQIAGRKGGAISRRRPRVGPRKSKEGGSK